MIKYGTTTVTLYMTSEFYILVWYFCNMTLYYMVLVMILCYMLWYYYDYDPVLFYGNFRYVIYVDLINTLLNG